LQTFHPAFALVCIIAFCFYGSLIPFNNIASDFLQYKYYAQDPHTAAYVMSIPDTLAIFLVPFLGSIVDRYGHKVKFLILGGICMCFGHYLLAFTSESPKLALWFNGIANSTLMVLWPWIPNLVEEPYWGSAYGIVTVCTNAAFTFVPFAIAHSLNSDPTYQSSEVLFIVLTGIGTLFCLLLARWNQQDNLGLDASERVSSIKHSSAQSLSPPSPPIELGQNLPFQPSSREPLFS
jgi:MFS family permease